MLKRSWIEIDLPAILNNLSIYQKGLLPGQEIMAVVKADAYGHGEREVSRALQEAGVKHFAVSNLDEAVHLRQAGIQGQILILGYTPPERAAVLFEEDITQALISEDYAERLADRHVKAQFALDTGMNRIGLDADDPAACEAVIRRYASRFELTGLFTHLCVADTPAEDAFTDGQIAKFEAVANRVADLKLPYVHCMNTAGGFWHNRFGSLVRLGVSLYGLKPDYANTLPEGIRPALSWKSVVALVKEVHAGETIGYGRTYTATETRRIATIPTGYADGFSRALSNRGGVWIRGQRAPIVGRVCMDQLMADVTDIAGVCFEDEVTLLGDMYNADDMAQDLNTIGYEVVCDIGKRVGRVYKR